MPIDAYREQPRKDRRGYSTVWRVYAQWTQDKIASAPPAAAAAAALPELPIPSEGQLPLWAAGVTGQDASVIG
jgi:hypothetical protein